MGGRLVEWKPVRCEVCGTRRKEKRVMDNGPTLKVYPRFERHDAANLARLVTCLHCSESSEIASAEELHVFATAHWQCQSHK